MDLKSYILNKNDIENLHDETLYLLKKYGVVFNDPRTIDLFRKHNAEINGSRIKINSKIIEECLHTLPSEFTICSRNPEKDLSIGKNYSPAIGPATGYIMVNSLSEGFKRASMQDYENFIKLSHLSKNISFADIGLLYPDHYNETKDFCIMANKTIHLSDKPLFEISTNEESAEHIIKMAEIAVNRKCSHYTIGIANAISPLQWDSTMLGLIHAFAKNFQPIILSVNAIAGCTASVKLNKAILQNNAEILSGIILSQIINPGTPAVYGIFSGAADFKSVNLCYGSPELQILATAASQMADFYHIPFRGGGSTTEAKELDCQAAMESAMSLTLSYLNKYNIIMQAVGGSESLLSINYEKWIIDEEILNRIKYLNNYKFTEISNSDIDNICSLNENESFMMQDETMLEFKNELFIPELSDRSRRNIWEKLNISITQKAEKIWKKKLEEYIPPEIDTSTSKTLKDYMNKNFNIQSSL